MRAVRPDDVKRPTPEKAAEKLTATLAAILEQARRIKEKTK